MVKVTRCVWFTAAASKREIVKSLLSATDNETVEEDVERDYNKLARHPKGNFVRCTVQEALLMQTEPCSRTAS